MNPLSSARLALALRDTLAALRLDRIADPQDGGRALRHPPSLDLAVVAFVPGGEPVAANVLWSREHPQGLIAPLPERFGPQQGLHYLADQRDEALNSVLWAPRADWSARRFETLGGTPGAPRFVAPYPASLLKLMIAVGVARHCGPDGYARPWTFGGRQRTLRDWQFDMLAVSCNTSTSALVAWLHAQGLLGPQRHALHELFAELQLPTLRLAGTQADGGWGNAAGAGVGQIQMTAWDTVRLLWWLDPAAPRPPWLSADAPQLDPAHRAEILRGLGEQGLDIVLSAGVLAGLPGAAPGLPNRLQALWVQPDGSWRAGEYDFPGDFRPRLAEGSVHFAHKIGNTENYSSDAGIVRGIAPARRHYLIALLSNLGSRYAFHPLAAGPRQLAQLGAAVDALLAEHLESPA